MQKTISTQELKTRIGEIMDAVRLRGDHYVIQRRGKPVAAVVPLSVQERDLHARERLFALMDQVSRRNKNVPGAVIEATIQQAIDEVRAEKRRKRKPS